MRDMNLLLYFVIFLEITAFVAGVTRVRRECHDTFHSCPSWSKAGMCDNNRFGFVMRGGCAKSCGFCKASANTIPKTNMEVSTQDVKSGLPTERKEEQKSDTQSSAHPSKLKPCGEKMIKDSGESEKVYSCADPSVPTTVTTPTTNTTEITPTTSTTPTTLPTPTTLTTITTYATAPMLSTPTTAATQSFPQFDSKEKPKPSNIKKEEDKDDDTKVKSKDCKDLFNKCQEWKEQKNICISPMFKPYMEFGCARSCSLCKSNVIHKAIAKSPHENGSLNIEVADKKDKLAVWPKNDEKEDVDSKLSDVVEIGIAREMIEAIKRPKKKSHPLRKTFRKKNTKATRQLKKSRSIIPQAKHAPKNKGIPSSEKSSTKRVEIENGFKSFSTLSKIKDVANVIDKMDLRSTKLGLSGSSLSSDNSELKTEAFDALNKELPDFGGIDSIVDEQKILNTPPKVNEKLDYYVEHFSKDPYVAESEREEWMKDNVRSKEYRRRVRELNSQVTGSRTSKHSSQSKQMARKINEKIKQKPNIKRVEIEDGFKEPSPFANLDGVAHLFNKVDGDKPNEIIDSLAKVPGFNALNNRKDVQELFETPTNKNFDYYVEHFSEDPYLAESEKEQWLKDSESRLNQFRRRLKDTRLLQSKKPRI